MIKAVNAWQCSDGSVYLDWPQAVSRQQEIDVGARYDLIAGQLLGWKIGVDGEQRVAEPEFRQFLLRNADALGKIFQAEDDVKS